VGRVGKVTGGFYHTTIMLTGRLMYIIMHDFAVISFHAYLTCWDSPKERPWDTPCVSPCNKVAVYITLQF